MKIKKKTIKKVKKVLKKAGKKVGKEVVKNIPIIVSAMVASAVSRKMVDPAYHPGLKEFWDEQERIAIETWFGNGCEGDPMTRDEIMRDDP